MTTPRIVVGIDGSAHARRALDVAIEEARLRGGTVEAVMAWTLPAIYPGMEFAVGSIVHSELQAAAEKELDEALAGVPSDVRIDRVVAVGNPAELLNKTAEGAALLVVGSRGRGGFKGLLLGSTSRAVVGRAPCPVLVVPPVHEGAGA